VAEFERGKVEGFELCDVGVWVGGSKAAGGLGQKEK